MENKVSYTKGLLFACFILIIAPSFSQTFDWYYDGYVDGGGVFKNIDNRGIDIRISGLYNEHKTANDSSIVTGINDQNHDGLTHTYSFDFSEWVNVEFTISGINRDSSFLECYNDQLIFLPTPIYSNARLVAISGDTAFAQGNSSFSGEVTVKYSKINGFSITHGAGIGCNPGFVVISSLRITSVNRSHMGPYVVNTIADNSILITGVNSTVRKVYVVNAIGQFMPHDFEIRSSETISIETSNLIDGAYVVFVEFESGQTLNEKVIIVHG